MATKKTIQDFIMEANEVHNNKYDYSKSVYNHSKSKLIIICPTHGEFLQTPNEHLRGKGCRGCQYDKISTDKQYTKEIFVSKANEVHNNKYDYSKSVYNHSKSKLIIICPTHGEFLQLPSAHLNGNGCRKCQYNVYGNLRRKNIKTFIKQAREVHRDKYDYSKSVYKNKRTKIKIICPKHGEFKQPPSSHLAGSGCPKCNESKGEKQIECWLSNNNICYVKQKTFPDCKFRELLKFDFFLPQHNILIEYDGKQHFVPVKFWGGEDKLKIIKQRDRIKNEWCNNQENINLIRIRYDENIIDKLSSFQFTQSIL